MFVMWKVTKVCVLPSDDLYGCAVSSGLIFHSGKENSVK